MLPNAFEWDSYLMRIPTVYGLAAAVFSHNINRALDVAHKLKAGTVWVNCYNMFHPGVPFGGFKQSGIGREMGQYALDTYVPHFVIFGSLKFTPFAWG